MCGQQEEPTYSDVRSVPGPKQRPTPRENTQQKPQVDNPTATYAAVIHSKQ